MPSMDGISSRRRDLDICLLHDQRRETVEGMGSFINHVAGGMFEYHPERQLPGTGGNGRAVTIAAESAFYCWEWLCTATAGEVTSADLTQLGSAPSTAIPRRIAAAAAPARMVTRVMMNLPSHASTWVYKRTNAAFVSPFVSQLQQNQSGITAHQPVAARTRLR